MAHGSERTCMLRWGGLEEARAEQASVSVLEKEGKDEPLSPAGVQVRESQGSGRSRGDFMAQAGLSRGKSRLRS